MTVQANWEKKEGNEGVLTITVPAERFETALDQAFKKVVKDVNIPGFRKGKVPRPIFEQRFGVESLYQDAIDIVLPSAYSEAVEQTDIFPVDQPSIDIDEIERGKDLVFVCEVTVKPEVKLGDYKGLEVDVEEELIGTETGETEVNVTFHEDYHAKELAGKEATFKVTIHEIKEKELPALDDEFAKDVDEEVESLEALKEKKREELLNERKQAAENKKREQLIEQVTENAEIDIPEAMVQTELDQMLNEFEQRLQMQGMNLETYFQFSGQTEEQLKEQMATDAQLRVKTNLVLEAVLEAEHIEVEEADIEADLENMASMYNLEKDQIIGMLGGNTNLLKEDLKIKKAIDFIVDESKAK